MTFAICINCGDEKIGALTPCLRCDFLPQAPDDQAKSIMLSDHNMSIANLRSISRLIRAGEPLKFNEAAVQTMSEHISTIDTRKIDADTSKFVKGYYLVLILVIIGLGWLIFKWST